MYTCTRVAVCIERQIAFPFISSMHEPAAGILVSFLYSSSLFLHCCGLAASLSLLQQNVIINSGTSSVKTAASSCKEAINDEDRAKKKKNKLNLPDSKRGFSL